MKRSKKIALISMLVGASLALLASLVLSVESLVLAANKDAILDCSISAVLNCASVAKDPSATILGFPNSYIGMIALPVMITIAVAILMGAKFTKLFMQLAQIGAVMGLIFALWMFFMSYFVIQVLCPWCLVTDLGMLLLFFGLTRYNLLEDNLTLNVNLRKKLKKIVEKDYDVATLIGVIVLAVASILIKYGSELFA